MSNKSFALVDCNSFYCSCERLFQPWLNHRPVIVLSNNDGCAISLSPEAKALGLKMGDPFFKIKGMIHKYKIAVFSSNYTLYGELSHRVMEHLANYSPEIEVYSIDEAFLSFNGFEQKELTNYGREIQQSVQQSVGIPVSVGIAPTKVLAKLANHISKKSKATKGVLDISDINVRTRALDIVSVDKVWGVGRKSAAKLAAFNIYTARDLSKASPQLIQKIMTIQGRRIVEELNGVSCIELELMESDKKQILSSRAFGRPTYKLEELKEAISCHTDIAARKLRKQNLIAKKLAVFIRTNPFKNNSQYSNSAFIELSSASNNTLKLTEKACELLDKIYRPHFEYKKVGVMLFDIQEEIYSQLNLFGEHDNLKNQELMKAYDSINRKFGSNTIHSAACGIERKWQMLRDYKSPNYTTRWSELLRVK